MAYNPQMPQMPQQMPQQGQQQQYQNPAANWQQTYQNSSWANRQPMQYQQQNPYQRQMPPQMPQQQMPQFSQQQINSFLNFMRSRPMPNFMADPRYQPQQSQRPVYQPTQTPALSSRVYNPAIQWNEGGMATMSGITPVTYTVGDSAADSWVKSKVGANANLKSDAERQRINSLYNQYYSGAI